MFPVKWPTQKKLPSFISAVQSINQIFNAFATVESETKRANKLENDCFEKKNNWKWEQHLAKYIEMSICVYVSSIYVWVCLDQNKIFSVISRNYQLNHSVHIFSVFFLLAKRNSLVLWVYFNLCVRLDFNSYQPILKHRLRGYLVGSVKQKYLSIWKQRVCVVVLYENRMANSMCLYMWN